MAADRVLVVAATAPPAAAEAQAIAAAAAAADAASCQFASPANLDALLSARDAASTAPVVVLMPSLENALALARAVHAARPHACLLIVRRAEDVPAFRASMGIAPLLGRHWSLAALEGPELQASLRQALAGARQRRQLRTTLTHANERLAQTRAMSVDEYQRLVASEHHLVNFLRHSQDAMLGLDPERKVLFWSQGAAQLLDVRAEEALGRPLVALGAWTAVVEQALAEAAGGRKRVLVESLVQLRGKERALEASLTLTGGDEGEARGASVVLRDVTARRRSQDQLQEANLDLQRLVSQRTQELEQSQLALLQAQKLEAIGKLTGGVAHDFNNVLQVIGINLQLLQPVVSEQAEGEHLLRAALSAVDRGAKLSSQLLAFARRQPLNPLPLSVGRKVRDMDDLLRRALGERVEVETALAAGLWTTLADGNQLENVILNLAINARDAMPEGGKLTIETANAVLDEDYTRDVPDVAPGQYVMLAISDTGHGMPPDVAAKAFEPFFTTKPEGQGTGLGLSMAYGFAKQSGGHIRIYSEMGHGTSVKLYLPRSFEKEIDAPRPLSGPVQGGSETILVVEDDLAVQAAVVSTLHSLGYRVLRAGDAQSALTVLQSGIHVDLLFTDVVMPGPLRSPELAQRARHLLPELAVLFTSGYTQNAIVHGGRLDPGVELLSKPYRQEDLARKVRHVLQNRPRQRQAPPTPPPAPSAADRGALRVLLVEDEDDLREVTQQMLELLGCEVQAVPSAELAMEVLNGPPFDLVLTDLGLPGRSGAELAREVRRLQPSARVVISSGYGEAAPGAADGSLPKPYGLPELQALLQQLRPG